MRSAIGAMCLLPLTLVSALPQKDAKPLEVMSRGAAKLNHTKDNAYKTEIDLEDNIIDYGTQNSGDIPSPRWK